MMKRICLLLAALFLAPVAPAVAQQLSFDSGMVSVSQTPANASHALGVSVGGLYTIPVVRTVGTGGSGIITGILITSTGGNTAASYLVRVWQKQPSGSTTCTDNVAFVSNAADDQNLIMGPTLVAPVAPGVVTGDAKTYAWLSGLTLDYRNRDVPVTVNLYVCLVASATDANDANSPVVVSLGGPQN